ncbi:MAG: hypothetical protein H6559_34120 [Lewinellaceae bacterium]|nr:hypothetical protein [Lewinellaceae bacterium]
METSWYPAVLAEALLNDPMEFSTEIRAIFNATAATGTSAPTAPCPPTSVDFVTVALHELGHGTGFAGFNAIDDGSGAAECEGLVTRDATVLMSAAPGIPISTRGRWKMTAEYL